MFISRYNTIHHHHRHHHDHSLAAQVVLDDSMPHYAAVELSVASQLLHTNIHCTCMYVGETNFHTHVVYLQCVIIMQLQKNDFRAAIQCKNMLSVQSLMCCVYSCVLDMTNQYK